MLKCQFDFQIDRRRRNIRSLGNKYLWTQHYFYLKQVQRTRVELLQVTHELRYRLNIPTVAFVKWNSLETHESVVSHYSNKPKDKLNFSATSGAQEGGYIVNLRVSYISLLIRAPTSSFWISVFEFRHFISPWQWIFLSFVPEQIPQTNHRNRFKTSLCFYCSAELNFIWFCFFPSEQHFIPSCA
jgi:hypothetical protein